MSENAIFGKFLPCPHISWQFSFDPENKNNDAQMNNLRSKKTRHIHEKESSTINKGLGRWK